MSGNRANAAAIQRRTMGAQNNVPPPGTSRPMQGQQQMQQQQIRQQPGGRQGQQFQQQQQMPQQPMQNPKMSVSDAIGLISLRLGRVETFIQQMPPLDQIGMNSSGDSGGEIGENMRVVDEAVFTNIVARLEKLEQTPRTVMESSTAPSAVPSSFPSLLNSEQLQGLNHSVDVLKAEMLQVKELLLSLQSFTMQTNQKLVDLVINVDGDNEMFDSENVVEASVENDESVNEVDGDEEILAGNIDLKAFVQSSM